MPDSNKDLKNKVIGITLGIRFNRSFRVSDISGEIIDDILYNSKSPFGADFFPRIQEGRREKVLFNPQTTEYFRINTDDIIIGLEVKDGNFDQRFSFLVNDVLNYLKDLLFKNYGLKNIRRVGVIFSHKIDRTDLLGSSVKALTKDKIGQVDNINISFSKKLAATESLYRKGVHDYKNTIYNLTEVDSSILAELDYQYYYNPPIEDLRECFVDKVIEDAKSFLDGSYYEWLKNTNTEDAKSK